MPRSKQFFEFSKAYTNELILEVPRLLVEQPVRHALVANRFDAFDHGINVRIELIVSQCSSEQLAHSRVQPSQFDNLVPELEERVCISSLIVYETVQQDNGHFSKVLPDQAPELHVVRAVQIVEWKVHQRFKGVDGAVETRYTLPKIVVQPFIALGKLGLKQVIRFPFGKLRVASGLPSLQIVPVTHDGHRSCVACSTMRISSPVGR